MPGSSALSKRTPVYRPDDSRYTPLKTLRRRDLPGFTALPTLMATPPTLVQGAAGAASAISGSTLVFPWDTSAFTYYGTVPGFGGTGFPGSAWFQSNAAVSTGRNVYAATTTASPWSAEFEFDTFDGKFEVKFYGKGSGSGIRVMVNGQLATQISTFVSPTADTAAYFGLVNLGTPGIYRIRLEMEGQAAFAGIQTHPLNAVNAAARRKAPRWIFMGDSFTEPTISDNGSPRTVTDGSLTSGSAVITSATAAFTAADYGKVVTGTGIPANTVILQAGMTSTQATLSNAATATSTGVSLTFTGVKHSGDGYVQQLGYMLGVDAWSCGLGGTGYLKTNGASVNFLSRITDVTNNAPDVVVFCGGINDYSSFTASAIGAQALACFQAVQAAVPGAQIIVMSPYTNRGHQSYGTNFLATADAIKAAAATVGAVFVDVLRLPAPATGANGGPAPTATTLAAAASATNTQISTVASVPLNTHIQIGTGTNAEVRRVTSVSGSGPYTLQFGGDTPGGGGAGLGSAHSAGESVTPVGQGISTGDGTQTTPNGSGTSDRYTGTDGTHPTILGHKNLARGIFRELTAKLTA